jgi:hypothetical protein
MSERERGRSRTSSSGSISVSRAKPLGRHWPDPVGRSPEGLAKDTLLFPHETCRSGRWRSCARQKQAADFRVRSTPVRVSLEVSLEKPRGVSRHYRLTPRQTWLRGLDLNQRPLGYEGKVRRDASQPRARNATKNRHSSPALVALSWHPSAAVFGQFSDSPVTAGPGRRRLIPSATKGAGLPGVQDDPPSGNGSASARSCDPPAAARS